MTNQSPQPRQSGIYESYPGLPMSPEQLKVALETAADDLLRWSGAGYTMPDGSRKTVGFYGGWASDSQGRSRDVNFTVARVEARDPYHQTSFTGYTIASDVNVVSPSGPMWGSTTYRTRAEFGPLPLWHHLSDRVHTSLETSEIFLPNRSVGLLDRWKILRGQNAEIPWVQANDTDTATKLTELLAFMQLAQAGELQSISTVNTTRQVGGVAIAGELRLLKLTKPDQVAHLHFQQLGIDGANGFSSAVSKNPDDLR